MYEEKNNVLLLKFVLLINSLSDELRGTLINWSQDIDADRLKIMVNGLNKGLSTQTNKLLPGPHF